MRIDEVPAVDVRGSLTARRGRLLSLLASMRTSAGSPATAITGNIPAPSGHEEFVRRLAQRNQRWVDGARTLDRPLITSKTTTCPWCCARSSGASRTNIKLRHRLAPPSPWTLPASARGRSPGPQPDGPSMNAGPPRRPLACSRAWDGSGRRSAARSQPGRGPRPRLRATDTRTVEVRHLSPACELAQQPRLG